MARKRRSGCKVVVFKKDRRGKKLPKSKWRTVRFCG